MNKDILKKALTCLLVQEHKMIDAHDLLYKIVKPNLKITSEEFVKVINDLFDIAGGLWDKTNPNIINKELEYTETFLESRVFFIYNGYKFIIRFMRGQGDAYQILDGSYNSSNWPNIKFPMQFEESKAIKL